MVAFVEISSWSFLMAGWGTLGNDGIAVDLGAAGGRPALWLTSCFDLLMRFGSTIFSAGRV